MLEAGENISDQIIQIKKQFLSFSKFYARLISTGATGFISMDKETQDMVLHDVYVNNSKLEHLLRDIHENEINGETLKRIFHGAGTSTARGGGGTGTEDPDAYDEEDYQDSDE